jgi:hypothetical protein
MTWLVLIAAATCIQVLVGELFDWFPWIAARLVRQAARCLPKESRARYENE